MGNIWIDVTTIINWRRPAVGIVRAELECARYALNHNAGADLRFCAFDGNSGYYEVSAGAVKQTIDSINGKSSFLPKENEHPVEPARKEILEKRLRRYALKIIFSLPVRYQRKLLDYLIPRKPAARSFIDSLRQAKRGIYQWFHPQARFQFSGNDSARSNNPDGKGYPFQPSDIYISLGLDWDQKDFAWLYSVKKSIGLEVRLFCHDTIPVMLPHLCVGDVAGKFSHYFADVAWCADEIFCISECTKRDLNNLLDALGTPKPRFTPVRLGCELPVVDQRARINEQISELTQQKYLLFVSTLERRKNHEVLYKAYTRLVDSAEENIPVLVFAGMYGWGINDLFSDLRLDPRVKDKIVVLTNVSDPELVMLYQHAWFTLFPSMYEGWGLPVAESLAFGKYCLASSAASIPEVAGDLLDYLDPWDVSAWENKIRYFIHHPQAIVQAEERIKTEFKPTTWSETAKAIITPARQI